MKRYTVALAGNPNTGKSTLFNALTGLRQHTGNWAGKTVVMAEGEHIFGETAFRLVDLPGTYSLYSNSADEEVARDYIIFEQPDVTVVVLDATAMERNLNLALQVLEMTSRVVLCVNLIDEAEKLGVHIDLDVLNRKLGVPAVAISARNKTGIAALMEQVERVAAGKTAPRPAEVPYREDIERKLAELTPHVQAVLGGRFPARWIALRLLDGDESLLQAIKKRIHDSSEPFGRKEVLSHGHGRTACR